MVWGFLGMNTNLQQAIAKKVQQKDFQFPGRLLQKPMTVVKSSKRDFIPSILSRSILGAVKSGNKKKKAASGFYNLSKHSQFIYKRAAKKI